MSRILSLATKLHFLFGTHPTPPTLAPSSMALKQLVRVRIELHSFQTIRTAYQVGRAFPAWQLQLGCLNLQRKVQTDAGTCEYMYMSVHCYYILLLVCLLPEDSSEPKGRLIWEGYKRNFKGSIPPKVSRKPQVIYSTSMAYYG